MNKQHIALLNNSIYISKSLFEDNDISNCKRDVLTTFVVNLFSFGYLPNTKVVNVLSRLSDDSIKTLYLDVKKSLWEIKGCKNYIPFYPNFPKQVEDMSNMELTYNAILHYATFGEFLPEFKIDPKFPLYEKTTPVTLGLLTEEILCEEYFPRKMKSPVSLTEFDINDIYDFINEYGTKYIPNVIPNKENLANILTYFFTSEKNNHVSELELKELFKNNIKTATDLLRFISVYSDCSSSLVDFVKVQNFSRKNRRFVLSVLNEIQNPLEDMDRYKDLWIKVGEKLHPGEYKNVYPKAFLCFNLLRNGKIDTFSRQVAAFISKKDFIGASQLLMTRPSEFARKLDFLLRNETINNGKKIIDMFEFVADKVSTPVLLQLRAHFYGRESCKHLRLFFPKGQTAKCYFKNESVEEISFPLIDRLLMVITTAIQLKLSKKEPLGKVFISEDLTGYTVPLVQRNASKSLHTISRGSRINLPENAEVIRAFLWWKNNDEKVDIDLSAVAITEDFKEKETIAYYNLVCGCGHHSGDITNAPNGACEFIDFNIKKAMSNEVRYLLFVATSYSEHPFCDLPECFVGFMTREDANSGEIFEPKTVSQKIDLSFKGKVCMPFAFDLQTREIIWLDIGKSKKSKVKLNNVEEQKDTLMLMLQGLVEKDYPDLYDLLQDNIIARGEEVYTKEEADLVFSLDGDVSPYMADLIMTEYL